LLIQANGTHLVSDLGATQQQPTFFGRPTWAAIGNYLEATGSAGINIGHIALLAGYRTVNPDIHSSNGQNGGIVLPGR
jgi:hypothetical protein